MNSITKYKLRQMRVLYLLFLGFGVVAGLTTAFVPFREYSSDWTFSLYLSDSVMAIRSLFNPVIGFFIAIMGISGFREYSSQSNMEFIRSLPYKRSSVWKNWYLMGILSIVLVHIMFIIGAIVRYELNWMDYSEKYMTTEIYSQLCAMDSVENVIIELLYSCMGAVFLYAIAVFSRMVMGNTLTSFLTFGGIIASPYVILDGLESIIKNQLQITKNIIPNSGMVVGNLFQGMSRYSVEDGIEIKNAVVKAGGGDTNVYIDYFRIKPVYFIILVGGFVLLTALSYHIMKKDFSTGKIGKNIVYENIFIICTGLYMAFILPRLSTFYKTSLETMLFSMVIVFVIVETLLIITLKKRHRYDSLNGDFITDRGDAK